MQLPPNLEEKWPDFFFFLVCMQAHAYSHTHTHTDMSHKSFESLPELLRKPTGSCSLRTYYTHVQYSTVHSHVSTTVVYIYCALVLVLVLVHPTGTVHSLRYSGVCGCVRVCMSGSSLKWGSKVSTTPLPKRAGMQAAALISFTNSQLAS